MGRKERGSRVTYWFTRKPRLTSLTLDRPGLIGLLSRRTFLISPLSTVFHYGMVVGLITGSILEAMYLIGLSSASFSGLFAGSGWVVTWVHGFFGFVTIVGFIGVLGRFATNRFFRLASGVTFYMDAALIASISVSGIALALQILGITPTVSGWWPTVHIISVITWLVASLLTGGLVAHAVGTILYRFSDPRSSAAFQAFNTACGRCGKCTQVCPLFRAHREKPEEAPSLKVRRYLSAFRKGGELQHLRQMTEEVYDCALCGLCVAVCPYSFRHYDLYMALLAQVNRTAKEERVET
jgi:NAD-dependent dihydropyrimidine dehydrogenase PreA subunit